MHLFTLHCQESISHFTALFHTSLPDLFILLRGYQVDSCLIDHMKGVVLSDDSGVGVASNFKVPA